jgi:hypothetical protein
MSYTFKVTPGEKVKVNPDSKVIVEVAPAIPAWDGGTIYNVGAIVTHDNKTWQCNHYAPAGAGPFGGYLDGSAPGHEGITYWIEVV